MSSTKAQEVELALLNSRALDVIEHYDYSKAGFAVLSEV
jgi:hypothetical protein